MNQISVLNNPQGVDMSLKKINQTKSIQPKQNHLIYSLFNKTFFLWLLNRKEVGVFQCRQWWIFALSTNYQWTFVFWVPYCKIAILETGCSITNILWILSTGQNRCQVLMSFQLKKVNISILEWKEVKDYFENYPNVANRLYCLN